MLLHPWVPNSTSRSLKKNSIRTILVCVLLSLKHFNLPICEVSGDLFFNSRLVRQLPQLNFQSFSVLSSCDINLNVFIQKNRFIAGLLMGPVILLLFWTSLKVKLLCYLSEQSAIYFVQHWAREKTDMFNCFW